MKGEIIFIKKISQCDNFNFSIEWSDGILQNYRLSDLQKQCPCAGCKDEKTGKTLINPAAIKEDVRAIRLSSVGRYALRIQFNSGCSSGIYSYDFLRQFSPKD